MPSGYHNGRTIYYIFGREAQNLIVGYTFDLKNNTLVPEMAPNPSAGREHVFHAWSLQGGSPETVAMREAGVAASAGG